MTTGILTTPAGFLVATAAAGIPNGRGHAWQDRWSTGQLPHGGWVIVADGITGGTRGESAAETAVADEVVEAEVDGDGGRSVSGAATSDH